MPFYLDRTGKEPDLSQMVDVAIKVLKQNPRGFFLMSEAAQIDSAGHGNDPDMVVRQTLMFDDAIRAALEFAREDGETLVVVTADHDTGGLSVGNANADHPKFTAGWTTTGHVANMVPVYAYGPGAERLTGTLDNTDIARICAQLWDRRLN